VRIKLKKPMVQFCGACLSMQNIHAAMIKGAKKAERR